MALLKITKRINNKQTTELIYNETTSYTHIPNGESLVEVSVFKYHVKGIMNPAIINYGNKRIIGPYNIECHPMTQLSDIVWEQPEVKQDNVTTITESESSQSKYKTTYNPNNNTYKCNCFGYFRAKDRQCKHIKALKEKIK